MILSSTSDSRKTKKAITLILKELDYHLCCEIIRTKKHPKSFIVLNWVIDEEYFYIAHVMYRKKNEQNASNAFPLGNRDKVPRERRYQS